MSKSECLILMLAFLLCGCIDNHKQVPPGVESTLKKAGRNRTELEKVMSFYQKKGDEQKLRAAFFLIENMADMYHHEGSGVEKYRSVFKRMDSLLNTGNGIFNRSWDSIQTLYPAPSVNAASVVSDASVINADFLLTHIECAFKAWGNPWARDLTFEEFCEYILPFKLVNEPPEFWMRDCQTRYKQLLKRGGSDKTAKDVCLSINNDLKKWFYINARFTSNWDISYSDLKTTRTGTCSHATQLTAYSMRSLGIPVVMDFTPHWANKNSSHQWNALLYKGKTYHFVGSESDPGRDKIMFTRSEWIRRKRGKVFRRMFSIQETSLAKKVTNLNTIPSEFRSTHIKDVTNEYVSAQDATIRLTNRSGEEYAYLCVFNESKWKPIFWGKIGWLDKVTFKNMETEIVYLPVFYRYKTVMPAGKPFILTKQGEVQIIEPNIKSITDVVVKRKYPEDKSNNVIPNEVYELFFWDNEWTSLGVQKATCDSLIYKNVPSGALYMVKNIKSGKQERIFTYEYGKQVWW